MAESQTAQQVDVLFQIFKDLNARDLNACARVCKNWRMVADTIKKRRTDIEYYFFFHCECEEDEERSRNDPCYSTKYNCFNIYRTYLWDLMIEPSTTIVLFSQSILQLAKYFFPTPKKRKYNGDPSSQDAGDGGSTSASADYVETRPVKHKTIYRYINCDGEYADEERLHYSSDSSDSFTNLNELEIPKKVMDKFVSFLPAKSEVGFCSARGLIGTFADRKNIKELETCPSLSIIHFPPIPGVNVHTFQLNSFQHGKRLSFEKSIGIKRSYGPVKCLLTFLYDSRERSPSMPQHQAISHFLEKERWRIAFAGTYIDQVCFPKQSGNLELCYGIAFTGENVEAASVMIPIDINSDEEIKEVLNTFKKGDLLQGQCLGFMFTDMGRTQDDNGEKCVSESELFHQVYPDIPLFGTYGSRTIGIDYVPDHLVERHKKYSWLKGPIQLSTIYVIVSVRA